MNSGHKLNRQQLEQLAMSLPHVVGIAEGVSATNEPVIKLLVDCPIEQIKLPDALQAADIELQYVGDVKAQ